MAEEVGALGGTEAGEDEAKEGDAAEGAEDRFPVEVGDEGGGKEEEDVEGDAHDDVEPEDGVVLLVGGLAFVGEGSRETALLQDAGDVGEDDEGGHLTVVLGRQNIEEPKSEDGLQQLHHTVAEAAPDEALGSLLLKRRRGHRWCRWRRSCRRCSCGQRRQHGDRRRHRRGGCRRCG